MIKMDSTCNSKRKLSPNQNVDIPHYIRQNVRKETPSILERVITATGFEKLVFLKNCFKRKIL